jgi:hypothetical protein
MSNFLNAICRVVQARARAREHCIDLGIFIPDLILSAQTPRGFSVLPRFSVHALGPSVSETPQRAARLLRRAESNQSPMCSADLVIQPCPKRKTFGSREMAGLRPGLPNAMPRLCQIWAVSNFLNAILTTAGTGRHVFARVYSLGLLRLSRSPLQRSEPFALHNPRAKGARHVASNLIHDQPAHRAASL